MSWIKVNCSLRTSPKLLTLASRLSVTPVTVLGAVCHAWMFADEHADDSGLVPHFNFEAFDTLVGVPGLGDAMSSIGWLEDTGDGLQFVEYAEHNGSTAKTRANAQKRQSKKRHGDVTPDRDGSVTRGEERRGDKKREDQDTPPADSGSGGGVSLAAAQSAVEADTRKSDTPVAALKTKVLSLTPTWARRKHLNQEEERALHLAADALRDTTDEQWACIRDWYGLKERSSEKLYRYELLGFLTNYPKPIDKAFEFFERSPKRRPGYKPKRPVQVAPPVKVAPKEEDLAEFKAGVAELKRKRSNA